ncbi:MAG: GNAT family N-acetyltransferase [Chloroflexi bacterium]|nr:MAG: GNAT family N-acetyltransferase [Chloroflexota bacterium]
MSASIVLREATPEDAAELLALKLQLDTESQFMMFEPGERNTTVEEMRAEIEADSSGDRGVAIVAVVDGRIVGYVGIERGAFRRIRHVGYIVAGVLREFGGQGIGTQLFVAAESWARAHGILRLELTVMAHNTAGVRLYQRSGFTIEGTRTSAMLVDGKLVDEFYMAKLLT